MWALMAAAISPGLAAQQTPAPDSARANTHVSGTVRTTDGAPVAGAGIQLGGTSYRAITTDSGTFDLAAVAPGKYTLVARGPANSGARVRITAIAGQNTPVDLVLVAGGAGSTTASGAETLPEVKVEGQRTPAAAGYGPGVSAAGSNEYSVSAAGIANLPAGTNTAITDVLTQMPGVAIDQNQQIHIRNTEGPQFQYQIDGAVVPIDINTNPPFISQINPMFIARLDLLDGILPSRYSYATGGIVAIQTRNGCDSPGGSVSLMAGQRIDIVPAADYAGCAGKLSYYASGQYDQGQNAFSSATPGPNPIHDRTAQGQGFATLSYPVNATTKVNVVFSAAGSNNQLPNVPNLEPVFSLAGASGFNSAAINSYLNFRDYLGIVSLRSTPGSNLSYQISYAAHSITQSFRPDNDGELIYQGVASNASHADADNTLQGDLTYQTGRHTIGTGFYLGEYHVRAGDTSLVFPVDTSGNQASSTPVTVINNAVATNILSGIYLNDLWQVTGRLKLNMGLRWDDMTGFTEHNQFDPTINLTYALAPRTTVHAGFARYMQVPSFLGISPTAPAAFAGSTAEGPPGIPTPQTEDDFEWDAGISDRLNSRVTLSEDAFFELTERYLDTGQFGVVPIFAPFNYDHGTIWGSESAVRYQDDKLSAYANVTIGRNLQKGVLTGQFNFDPDELAFINAHSIVLDHQPLYGAAAGASYRWHDFTFVFDGIYSSGLRGGFADLEQLPTVLQLNAGVQRDFRIPGVGTVSDRLTVLNLLDRVNLIRPSEGIGIFQSSYGPRFTVLNTLSFSFGKDR
jgi:TonB dependent receptor/Carboxypeptidase regulatory-like domain/TonB-dependent Receptor Plug Domain